MKVFVVTYDDGDYYCEGDHILGIYTTREDAQEAILGASDYWKQQGVLISAYSYEFAIGEYELNTYQD